MIKFNGIKPTESAIKAFSKLEHTTACISCADLSDDELLELINFILRYSIDIEIYCSGSYNNLSFSCNKIIVDEIFMKSFDLMETNKWKLDMRIYND